MKKIAKKSVSFFIKKTKLLKNGEAPIFARIYNVDERVEFGLKKSVPVKMRDAKKQAVKLRHPQSSEINTELDLIRNKVSAIEKVALIDGEEVTPHYIKDRIVGTKAVNKSILALFRGHNEDAKKLIGIDFAADTVQRYETSYMHTKDFIKWHYNREDLFLDELNQQFVKNYELYLKTERGCSHNTTVKYLKNFKKIVRIALANKWMENDPFASVKYKLETVDAVYLTQEELELVRTKEIKIQRIGQVRDAVGS